MIHAYALDDALMATANEFVFATGDLAHVSNRDGRLWFCGVIESIHGDGTYDVRYNRGFSAHCVEPSLIRTAVRRKDDSPDPALPDPTPLAETPPAETEEEEKARQAPPVEPPAVELPPASEEGGSDNGASTGGSAGSASDKDITSILQDFQHRRVGYGYSQADAWAMIKKAYLAGRSAEKAAQNLPPPVVKPPLMGGTGKHAGTEKGFCRVCGEHHITSAGAPQCELRCWNKKHKDERQGNPKEGKGREMLSARRRRPTPTSTILVLRSSALFNLRCWLCRRACPRRVCVGSPGGSGRSVGKVGSGRSDRSDRPYPDIPFFVCLKRNIYETPPPPHKANFYVA